MTWDDRLLEGRGVQPDVEVVPTPSDLRAGKDLALSESVGSHRELDDAKARTISGCGAVGPSRFQPAAAIPLVSVYRETRRQR